MGAPVEDQHKPFEVDSKEKGKNPQRKRTTRKATSKVDVHDDVNDGNADVREYGALKDARLTTIADSKTTSKRSRKKPNVDDEIISGPEAKDNIESEPPPNAVETNNVLSKKEPKSKTTSSAERSKGKKKSR